MAHPRVEEVEDSDVDMSDPSEADIDDFAESDILRRRLPAGASGGSTTAAASHLTSPAHVPSPGAGGSALHGIQTVRNTADVAQYAGFQCLYPIYFDASRTRAQGRRVSRGLAVANPLAGEIVNACARLRLPMLFEPGKTHPKDWANPGRVKVRLDVPARERPPGMASVKNKHHLYLLVARHLKENPAADHSPALTVPGAPMPDPKKPYPRPAIPRGWKMGELLPFISPAMTGGGVSENLFKDMMKEMQGGGDPMASLMGGPGPSGSGGGSEEKKSKRDKKKGKS